MSALRDDGVMLSLLSVVLVGVVSEVQHRRSQRAFGAMVGAAIPGPVGAGIGAAYAGEKQPTTGTYAVPFRAGMGATAGALLGLSAGPVGPVVGEVAGAGIGALSAPEG